MGRWMDLAPTLPAPPRDVAADVAGRDHQRATGLERACRLFDRPHRMRKMFDRVPHADQIEGSRILRRIEKVAAFHGKPKGLPCVRDSFLRDVGPRNVPVCAGQVQEKAVGATDLVEPPGWSELEEPADLLAEVAADDPLIAAVVVVLAPFEILPRIEVRGGAPSVKDQAAPRALENLLGRKLREHLPGVSAELALHRRVLSGGGEAFSRPTLRSTR